MPIQKRHSVWVYVSMIGLVLTGLLQANRSPAFQGLFSFGNTYSSVLTIKHILVVAMIAIALYRSLVLGRKMGAVYAIPGKAKGQFAHGQYCVGCCHSIAQRVYSHTLIWDTASLVKIKMTG